MGPVSSLNGTPEEPSESTTLDLEEERTSIEGLSSKNRPNGRYSVSRVRRQDSERPTVERQNPHALPDWEEKTMVDGDSDEPSMDSLESSTTMDEPTVEKQHRRTPRPSQPSTPAPTEHSGPASGQLVVIAGNDQNRTIDLYGKTITVGRGLDNDIVLTDISVSRKHLSLKFDGSHYRLIDHGSGNGTFVNDRLETGSCQLLDGDRLEIGQTVMRFEHPNSRGAGAGGRRQHRHRTNTPIEHPQLPARPSQPIAHTPSPAPSRPYGRPPRPRSVLPPPQRDRASTAPPSPPAPGLVVPPGENYPGTPPATSDRDRAAAAATPEPILVASDGLPERADPSLLQHNSGPLMSAYPTGPLPPGMMTGPASPVSPGVAPKTPDAYLAALPPMDLRPKRRGLVIGLVALLLVGGATAGGAVYFLRSGGLPFISEDSNDDGITAENPATERPGPALPRDTWGTDETVLVSGARPGAELEKPERPKKNRDKSTAAKATGPDDSKAVKATKTPDKKIETAAIDTGQQPKKEDKPPSKDKADKKATGRQSNRNASSTVNRKAIEAKARKSALNQYKQRNFSAAARTLRSAASDLSAKKGAALRSLAGNYLKVGNELSKAKNGKTAEAYNAYWKAQNLDRRHGKSNLASYIRPKLGEAAAKAAFAFVSSDKLEQAKIAADRASKAGKGGTKTVRSVRQKLATKAGALFKQGLRSEKKNPAEARRLYNRVLKIVPSSDNSHGKARSGLSRLGKK